MTLRLTPAQYRELTGQSAVPKRARQQSTRPAKVPLSSRGAWPKIEHDAESIVFWFPAPGRAPTANDRGHWTDRQEAVSSWRSMTAMFARRVPFERDVPSIVTVLVPSGVRDAANLSVPCAKAMVDGLVDAKLFTDDDTQRVYVGQPVPLPRSVDVAGVAITPMKVGVGRALRVADAAAGRVLSASVAA